MAVALMCVVPSASEFEVVKLVRATISEWNPMMDLQPLARAAYHAHLVAAVYLLADASPFPS
jgi:hypothetical protein